ncbi:phenylalanyl-tRNA synthetase, alpha subunit [Thermoplasmatales archaeon BRNA1]|nr:phenylalanyl-tRNA synthetase, alpha subunit [Thermoplasmatales archaeon BRNA1]
MVITMDMEEVLKGLSYNEKKLLLALDKVGGKASPSQLIGAGEFSLEVEIMGSASWLQSKGLAAIREESRKFYALSDVEESRKGLPERKALKAIDAAGGKITLEALAAAIPGEDKIAVGWLMRKKLASMQDEGETKVLTLIDNGKKALGETMPDEALIARMIESQVPEGEADAQVIKDLKGRKGMIKDVVETAREVALTEAGRIAARSGIELREETADVTDELIQSGKWADTDYRRYDYTTFAPAVYAAKKNPLTRLGNDIRRMFIEMGFTEMTSEYVQPAFWNMDCLFIPQDHPARDMQDTFFLDNPKRIDLKDCALVQKVKEIQLNGGDTGSTGWGGEWSVEKASQALLRTHSTCSSVRYLAAHPDAPQKAFSISRIFRKESIDATHLPEFSQIEGIIIDENANLDMLIAIIREFYSRMGFDKIHVRPSYFPYTEPSLEFEVFFNGKWLELGGAGIFRPEVLAPFGVKYPVLAWGFGFERLAMLKWNIKDIRDLYIADIDFLRKNTVY